MQSIAICFASEEECHMEDDGHDHSYRSFCLQHQQRTVRMSPIERKARRSICLNDAERWQSTRVPSTKERTLRRRSSEWFVTAAGGKKGENWRDNKWEHHRFLKSGRNRTGIYISWRNTFFKLLLLPLCGISKTTEIWRMMTSVSVKLLNDTMSLFTFKHRFPQAKLSNFRLELLLQQSHSNW